MTRVSKNSLDKQFQEQIEGSFRWLLSTLKNDDGIKIFLNDFLTVEERVMLSKRLFIGYLIAFGLDYREISELLKVSTTTVGKMKDWMERRPGYRGVIALLVKRQKAKEFDKKLTKILRRIFPSSRADWARLAGTSDFPDQIPLY